MTHPAELAVIVPTFNEAQNVERMVEALKRALPGVAYEVIFVDDDSHDGTVAELYDLCQREGNVRLVHRIGRRGLSSAVVEGFQASVAPIIAVLDGDMQHDETKLSDMLEIVRGDAADLVVGSRYMSGGGFGDWEEDRQALSRFATRVAKLVTRVQFSDPMSGFFMMTRPAFSKAVRRLSATGYKILLDIAASHPGGLRVAEVPYEFRAREYGDSKLDSLVVLEFVFLLIEKITRGLVPAKFIMFGLVGATGVGVHFAALGSLINQAEDNFLVAQSVATGIAMTSNFFLNNWLTYYDSRIKGWRLLPALLAFYAVCSLGAVANVGVANFVFEADYTWWISGFAGALVGSVWNYTASKVLAWRR